LITLGFGWWGVLSFLLTPLIVVHNVIRYVCCLGMPPVPRIQPRAGAPARPTASLQCPKPASRRIEIIWDLPEGPVKNGGKPADAG
jgi:hypothetical protein